MHPCFYFMYVLVTYKNEEDQMKNEGARVVTLYSYILDAQGQLTLKLVVGCGEKSNSFKLLWLSLLPAKMRKTEDPLKNEGARVVTTDL